MDIDSTALTGMKIHNIEINDFLNPTSRIGTKVIRVPDDAAPHQPMNQSMPAIVL